MDSLLKFYGKKKRLLRGKHKERAILYLKKKKKLCTLETISKIKIKTIQEKGFVLRNCFQILEKKKRKAGFGPFGSKNPWFLFIFYRRKFYFEFLRFNLKMALIEALKMLHWKAFHSRVNLKCSHLLKSY